MRNLDAFMVLEIMGFKIGPFMMEDCMAYQLVVLVPIPAGSNLNGQVMQGMERLNGITEAA